jgi:hypothetical protein
MSDQVDLNVASKESVALSLTLKIAHSERLHDRKGILDLYAECLEATSRCRSLDEA